MTGFCASMFLVNAYQLWYFYIWTYLARILLENIEGQLPVAFALLCDSRFWLAQSLFAHRVNTESINTHTAQTITFCSYLFSRRWEARIAGNLHWSARHKKSSLHYNVRSMNCYCQRFYSVTAILAKLLLTSNVSLRWPAIVFFFKKISP